VIGEETARETAGEGSRVKKESIVDPCFELSSFVICFCLLFSYSCNRQVTDIRTERQQQADRPTERQTTGEIRLRHTQIRWLVLVGYNHKMQKIRLTGLIMYGLDLTND
jgi:hypothetical protein